MIRDLGFDFARIPMDYWYWLDADWRAAGRPAAGDVMKIKESALADADRVVELGRKYGIHVSLNFHRAPGYCINNAELEPFRWCGKAWAYIAAKQAPSTRRRTTLS